MSDKYFRPLEVNELISDSSKIYKTLGWKPEISFENMIAEMIDSDYNSLKLNENKKI